MKSFRVLGLAVLAIVPTPASAQLLDFALLDVSSEKQTLVLVRALHMDKPGEPDPLLTAVATRWDTGSSATAAYTHRWAIRRSEHEWLLGAGGGVSAFRSRTSNEEDANALSLRAQTEFLGPLAAGRYYVLLQYSSFRQQSYALAQYDFSDSAIGLELASLHESTHNQVDVALRYALDARKRWRARVGLERTNGETQGFIGLAYNGF